METQSVQKQALPKDGQIISKRVFIGGLAHETSETDLEVFFSEYGEVSDVRIVYDRKTGKNKGYGFVTFNRQESSTHLIDLDTVFYKGRKLRLRQAVRKNMFAQYSALQKKHISEGRVILVPKMFHPETIHSQVTPQITNYTYGYPEYYTYPQLQPVVQQPQYVYSSHLATYGPCVYYYLHDEPFNSPSIY